MKLIDILEDVIDLASERKKRDFVKKVDQMTKPDYDDPALLDLQPKHNKLIIKLFQKYGSQIKEMRKFLSSPVMSGGFKSAYALGEALATWVRKKQETPEQTRRAIQRAAVDDFLFRKVQQYGALWSAITEHFPMEIIWVIPHIDDFEVLSDLTENLEKARQYYHGK